MVKKAATQVDLDLQPAESSSVSYLLGIMTRRQPLISPPSVRFQEEQLNVTHRSDDSTICYFLTGKVDETLTIKLGEESPATFAKVLQKAKKMIDGQELLRTKTGQTEKKSDLKKTSQQEKGKVDSKSKAKGSASQSSQGRSDRNSDSGSSQGRPYERYTPTTIPIFEILTNIEDTGMEKLLKCPRKLQGDLNKRNREKYYRFHRDHDHDTLSCFKLKHQIEDLIKDDYFKKFVGKPRSSSVEKKEKRRCSRTPSRRDDQLVVINTIFRGPSGGQSENKRKELARQARYDIFTAKV